MKFTDKDAYWAAVSSDFGMFIRQAFTTIHQGKEFDNNWHIEAIVGELERSLRGEAPILVINMPPRHLKSFLISVVWPAFLLTREPSLKIVCVSYSDELARNIARDFRRLVESSWYHQLFPQVRLTKISENEISTNQGGFRAALSVHGSITGRGADLIIVDDPCRPEDAVSDKARTAVNEWFRSTLLSRLDDKRRSGLIIVMQRLHVNDLTGFVEGLAKVRKLSLASVAEADQKIELRNGKLHLRRSGDVLQPQREDRAVLEQLKSQIGSFNFQAQYQQSPKTPEGTLFKLKHFRLVNQMPTMTAGGEFFISIDAAASTQATANYTAISVVYIDHQRFYVVDVLRERWDFDELRTKTLDLVTRYARPGRPVHVVIENASTGISLVQYLSKLQDPRLRPVSRQPKEDKVTRAARVLAWFDAGIHLINVEGKNEWVKPYLNEFMNFPNGSNDDQVDSLVQLLHWKYVLAKLPRPMYGAD